MALPESCHRKSHRRRDGRTEQEQLLRSAWGSSAASGAVAARRKRRGHLSRESLLLSTAAAAAPSLLGLFFVLVGCCLCPCASAAAASSASPDALLWRGEFVAGSFILTQNSLNEAPYRYAGVLRKALDKVETKDPPAQSDEKNCDVRYRIRPSGRRSKLRINDETLTVTLKENNTVVVGAKIYVEVAAKTWIWKGINFGLLGCLKMNSCNGQIVTYSANVDFQIAFQVFWLEGEQRLQVRIKPVNTALHDVKVKGCKPPWYLFWFKKWQSLLNAGVQEAFQSYADNYEHQAEVPEVFSPFKDVFIQYKITNLIWNPDYVIFKANASFSALIEGQNHTYIPENSPGDHLQSVPESNWNMTSPLDGDSHLLQGVRVSTEFLNSLMWYASMTNVTRYHGATRILDSNINGTISYTPPVIKVERDNLLSIGIGHGLLLATCLPTEGDKKEMAAFITKTRSSTCPGCSRMIGNSTHPATLFRAEFSDLYGSGRIRLMSSRDQTGIRVSLDDLDLSRMVTKPFEPKLPLPESFENELMRNAIAQLQPIVNQYLENRPLVLPENVAPFAAAPELYLWNTGNGTGYAELMSYCSCKESKSKFVHCDLRSHICDGKGRKEFEVIKTDEDDDDGLIVGFRDVVKDGVKGIINIAKDVINKQRNRTRNDDEDGVDGTTFEAGLGVSAGERDHHTHAHHDTLNVNFTEIVRTKNFSYTGIHFTLFEDDASCSLAQPGDSVKVYWLWRTGQCTPLYLRGMNTHQFYFLDDSHAHFGCEDGNCAKCQFKVELSSWDQRCITIEGSRESFYIGTPDIQAWKHQATKEKENETVSLIANVFFNDEFCSFLPNYVEPQLVSSHTHLGDLKSQPCMGTTRSGDSVSNQYNGNTSTVLSAAWDCEQKCFGCIFRLRGVPLGHCELYQDGAQVIFTKTVSKIGLGDVDQVILDAIDRHPEIVYGSVSAVAFLSLVFLLTVISYKVKKAKKKSRQVQKSPEEERLQRNQQETGGAKVKQRSLSLRTKDFFHALVHDHIGVRFRHWSKEQSKEIQEDVIQNALLIANGILAIVFALEWNGDNNPLLIIHNKFQSGFAVDKDVFQTDQVAEFASKLNFLTYTVNVGNAIIAFLLVFCWVFSKSGDRAVWMRFRLFSCISMLAGIFVVIAVTIFTTFFDELVVLEEDRGFFMTDNDSMHRMASKVLKVSLNGLSLTVISFTIVFLFHGVGGGLFCGTIVFRLLHVNSKKSNMEILTTLLVILTIIQPFICLHPVIIWSQDSNNNSTFLLLVIAIWSLPLAIHILAKAAITQGRPRWAQIRLCDGEGVVTPEKEQPRKTKRTSRSLVIFDYGIQAFQLVIFLVSFSIITHFIVNTEFNQERKNLQDFVLPAIVSVFLWMASISYLLLSLVVEDTRNPEKRLIFKDQDLDEARNVLKQSLRRRLERMDKARTIANHYNVHRRAPPPPVPPKPSKKYFPSTEESISLSDSMNAGLGRRRGDIKRFTMPATTSFMLRKSSSKRVKRPDVPPPPPPPVVAANKPELPQKPAPDKVLQRMRERSETRVSQESPRERAEVELIESASEASIAESDRIITDTSSGCCWRVLRSSYHFIMETYEYRDPNTHGWRIKFRRLFLTCGVILFTYLTIQTTISTQDFSSKDEIQTLLDYAGMNLTWPDSGSVLDDVFQLYNDMERAKAYTMMGSGVLFWASLFFDFASHFTFSDHRRTLYVTLSRLTNFFGSLAVFASVVVVGLPDYLEASHLDEISPFCGIDFNRTVRQVAEFTIGLFFACLFTFQLLPILVTIGPALVRASVLILIHPSLQLQSEPTGSSENTLDDESERVTTLRMTILQQVIGFSALLTFPVTFISMAIVQQYQKDTVVTILILAYWCIPPIVLFVGLHYTRKYRRYTILLYVYYLYNLCYVVSLSVMVFYSLTFETLLETLQKIFREPTFWASSMAQIFLCNVVISDILYMTIF